MPSVRKSCSYFVVPQRVLLVQNYEVVRQALNNSPLFKVVKQARDGDSGNTDE